MLIATERQEQEHQQQARSQRALDVLLWALLALLLLPAASTLSSLPWMHDLPAWMLPATLATGLGIGAFLSLLRLSTRFWWASLLAAPLLGAAVAVGALLAARGSISGSMGGSVAGTPATGTVLLGAYVTLLSASLPWLVFRVKQTWLAIVVVWITVAGIWHVSLTPQQVWWLLVLLVLSLLLLGLSHLRDDVRLWRAADLQRLGPVLWPSARTIVGLSLVVALVGLIPLAAQLGVLGQVLRRSPLGQAGPLLFDSPQGPPAAVLGAPLSLDAPDVSSPQVILTYDIVPAPADPTNAIAVPPADFPGTPPLLGATLDTFSGTTWTQSGGLSSVPVRNALKGPAGSLTMQARITMRNPPRTANGSFLLGFDQPLGFSVPAKAQVVDGTAPTPLTVAGWESSAPLVPGTIYSVTAAVMPATAVGTGAISPALLERLTATPGTQTRELRALAQSWVDASQPPSAQAAALLDALQAHMTLDTRAAPPSGVDGVEWFLQGKRGNVLLFTTTYILLGRSIGLPLRLAEGYLPGSYDDTVQHWVVRGSDAAVWAQLAIPDMGWLDFFPASNAIKVTVPSKVIYSGTPPVITPTPQATSPSTNPQQQIKRSPQQDSVSVQSVLLVGGLVLTVLLALLVSAVVVVLSWRWSRVGAQLGPLTQLFARVAVLARLAGIRLRPSDTATQATAKVAAYLPEQTETLVTLNGMYERIRYGPPAGRSVLSSLRAQWLHMRGALMRLVVTRPWRRPPTVEMPERRESAARTR